MVCGEARPSVVQFDGHGGTLETVSSICNTEEQLFSITTTLPYILNPLNILVEAVAIENDIIFVFLLID